MSKKGLNITKRKDGRWEARLIYAYDENHNAKYRYIYGKSFTEAKEKREKIQSDILLHKNYVSRNNMHLKDVCMLFLVHKQIAVKKSTLLHYKSLINTRIAPLWNYRLSDINSAIVEKYIQDFLLPGGQNNNGFSIKTVRDILSLLRSIFKYAISEKYMSAEILNFSMPHLSNRSIAILDKKEQAQLEDFVLKNIDSYKLGVLLALYSGLRIGELCALKWSDIDLVHSQIHICHTLQRIACDTQPKTKIIITEPKTSTSDRIIPLPQFLNVILLNQKPQISAYDFYVLTGTNKYIEPSNYYMRYTRWLKRLNIKHYSFHALRHTFATRCIESGFDVKALSELLGHSNVNITLNRYVHPSIETKKRYMENLSLLCLQSDQ